MEIILADAAGFCFGVKRALDTSFKTASENEGAPIYTLGPLIHNPQVVEELTQKGVQVSKQSEDIDAGVVIVRCHGISPKVMKDIENRGLKIVDATCPFVRRAMRWARQLKDEGYQVIIVGDESHPEVKAIYGASEESAWIIKTPQAIDELPLAKRVGVIAQTTQSTDNYKKCIGQLVEIAEEIKAFHTICTATEQRQTSARELAAQVETMIVIGGRNSANTKRLAEVCQESGAQTYHIEEAEELQLAWFKGVNKVGVTAGASTPNWLIEGVINRMKEFTEKNVEETEEVNNEEVVAAEEEKQEENEVNPEDTQAVEAENQEQMELESLPEISSGKIISGTVEQISADEVLVNIGYKSEGRIPINELGLKPGEAVEDVLSVGDEIDVWVLKVEDSEGAVLLSKRRADSKKAWEELERLYQEQETIEATVTQTVKGGLLVDVGVRGFIPASHISRGFADDLDKYVGQTLNLKVIELDRRKNNVVLSHKEVLEEDYQAAKEKAFNDLEENMIVDGVVKRITNFGAFVDIGEGIEGLLHVSEMAHSRVNHPSDILSEGDEIKVMVLGIDKENERISLGLKQTLADPWDTIIDRYQIGDKVSGVVTRTVDFGAFVKLEDGVEGLVHISQLSHRHVAKVEEVVKPGDEIEAKIISLDPEARRIGLSIRELEPAPEQAKPEVSQANKKQSRSQNKEEEEDQFTTTLGDVFGDLFKKE